jgi:hypothetical protein
VLALFGSYKGYELLDYYFPMILMFLPSACFLLSRTNKESSSFRSYPYVYKSLSYQEVGQECMSICQAHRTLILSPTSNNIKPVGRVHAKQNKSP